MIKFNLLNSNVEHYKKAWLLALTAHTRGKETTEHVERVGELSVAFAKHLSLDWSELNFIEIGAPLHDIGKLGVSPEIINKPGKLTDLEYESMKTHALIGSEILKKAKIFPAQAYLIAEQHHEKWDGSGYPNNISGNNIYIGARIFSLVDTYDAMTNNRCYRNKQSKKKAVEEINRFAGIQFDPTLSELFERFIYAN